MNIFVTVSNRTPKWSVLTNKVTKLQLFNLVFKNNNRFDRHAEKNLSKKLGVLLYSRALIVVSNAIIAAYLFFDRGLVKELR